MGDKTDLVGLGAIALVGYFLIKKINDLGSSAVNTATTYIEETADNFFDIQKPSEMTETQQKALANYKKGNVTTKTVADPNSLYAKLFGGKTTAVKVDNVVQVNPTKQTTETSAFTLEMPDYLASVGTGKVSSGTSTAKVVTTIPKVVKASAGGYSVARESGTTVNAGRYAPIKVKVRR